MTETFITGVGVTLAFILMWGLAIMCYPLLGAFAGWVVSLFFNDTILTVLKHMGMDTTNLALWQLGATLGFISGFFSVSAKTTCEKR